MRCYFRLDNPEFDIEFDITCSKIICLFVGKAEWSLKVMGYYMHLLSLVLRSY